MVNKRGVSAGDGTPCCRVTYRRFQGASWYPALTDLTAGSAAYLTSYTSYLYKHKPFSLSLFLDATAVWKLVYPVVCGTYSSLLASVTTVYRLPSEQPVVAHEQLVDVVRRFRGPAGQLKQVAHLLVNRPHHVVVQEEVRPCRIHLPHDLV